MKHSIWTIIILILILSSCRDIKSSSNEPFSESRNIDIPITPSSESGVDSIVINDFTTKIEKQEYPNIHSVLVAKNGSLIYEKYFSGNDQNYGKDIGTIHHKDTTLHDLRSISKSVVSACIGIAIDQGIIKGVDQKISDFFPEISFEGEKSIWTIEHFLTMTTGLVWNENVPYNDSKNDEIQMTYSKDPVVYVVKKPLQNKPGEKFNYNGGATQVLAEIIERASSTALDQFANEHLFLPLGIENFKWNKYSVWEGADEFAAPSGLRLTSRDLLKIGLLYRNQGNWNNKQVISEKWINESFKQKIEFPSEVSDGNEWYGYQFWIWPDIFQNDEFTMIAANGNGGQNIFWDLENDLVVVTTAGNYNKWDIKNDPYALLKNEIYPIFLKERK